MSTDGREGCRRTSTAGGSAWWATATAFLMVLLPVAGCRSEPSTDRLSDAVAIREKLDDHSREFERNVYEVTDGVYQAVGFGLANSILVEGDDCVFIVDVMGSVEAARAVKSAFDRISGKPIGALIYTHNHADHVFGGRGFVPDQDVDVYAHATTEYYVNRLVNIIRPIISARSARMFGDVLPENGPDALINDGIGPFLELGPEGGTLGFIRPNHTFTDSLETVICGVRVRLVHAPGETNDQIFVWLPDKKVLLPGDNVYKSFPNLYTIRGTLYRDVLEWARSIDTMRDLQAEHLVPSHTKAVSGRERIDDILTAYRDAIQYVHDQTVRGMNAGLTADELVETVRLPPHLAEHPYLQEYYGTVEWSVRSVFDGYLGWFDGNTATLSPASPQERARGYVELAGGEDALADAVDRALEQQHYAWAAELADHLLRIQPDNEEARRRKATALRALGERSISTAGRNFYLTQALELEGRVRIPSDPKLDDRVKPFLTTIPIENFMAAMPTHLDPERSADVDTVAGFRFTDVDQGFTLHVRRGVAEFRSRFPDNPDLTITTTAEVWREIAAGLRSPALALMTGAVQVDGSRLDLVGFLRLFQR